MMRTVSVAVYVEDESTNAAKRIPTNSGFGPRETSSNVVERVLTFVLTLPILELNPLFYKVEARAGIEPAHTGFANQCITTLLPRQTLFERSMSIGHVWGMSTG